MAMRNILGLAALAGLAAVRPAAAGPTNVVAAHGAPDAASAVYAVSPDLDDTTRRALETGLRAAGLRVASAAEAHDRLVTVRVGVQRLCVSYCVGILSDNYRRYVMVSAQAVAGSQASQAQAQVWYAVLQSDGLSGRRDDYLPALLRAGARAYGRSLPGERIPPIPRSGRYLLPELSAAG